LVFWVLTNPPWRNNQKAHEHTGAIEYEKKLSLIHTRDFSKLPSNIYSK